MIYQHTPEQAYMTVSIARLLRDGETVFHGIASPIPMLAILFAQRTHAPNLTYLNSAGSVNPRPTCLPHSTVDPHLLEKTSSLFPMSEAFDLAAKGRLDSVFLSGLQIDRKGNLNMSAIGPLEKPKVRLPGGAASAFLAANVGRVLLWRAKHDQRSFVNELAFCTATPKQEVYVATPLCVFHREHSELVVASIHPHSSESEIRRNTGWNVVFSAHVRTTPPLSEDDWHLLNELDPEHAIAVEF